MSFKLHNRTLPRAVWTSLNHMLTTWMNRWQRDCGLDQEQILCRFTVATKKPQPFLSKKKNVSAVAAIFFFFFTTNLFHWSQLNPKNSKKKRSCSQHDLRNSPGQGPCPSWKVIGGTFCLSLKAAQSDPARLCFRRIELRIQENFSKSDWKCASFLLVLGKTDVRHLYVKQSDPLLNPKSNVEFFRHLVLNSLAQKPPH